MLMSGIVVIVPVPPLDAPAPMAARFRTFTVVVLGIAIVGKTPSYTALVTPAMSTFAPTACVVSNPCGAVNVTVTTPKASTAIAEMTPTNAGFTVVPVASENACGGNPLPSAIIMRLVNCANCGSSDVIPSIPPFGVLA